MYVAKVDGKPVYAATDESRFINEVAKRYMAANVTLELNGQPLVLVEHSC